jgi:hypothetical protein
MINENCFLKPLQSIILNAVVFTLEIFILYILQDAYYIKYAIKAGLFFVDLYLMVLLFTIMI